MNKVILMGRLTKDPEIRYTTGEKQMAVGRYTLAVDRRSKDEDKADFITCVVFDKRAEFAEKYFKQGQRVLVTGSWQTGSYTNKDGQKVYTNECLVSDQEFADSKSEASQPKKESNDGFMQIPDDVADEGLPFD